MVKVPLRATMCLGGKCLGVCMEWLVVLTIDLVTGASFGWSEVQ